MPTASSIPFGSRWLFWMRIAQVVSANRSFYRTFAMTPEAVVGRIFGTVGDSSRSSPTAQFLRSRSGGPRIGRQIRDRDRTAAVRRSGAARERPEIARGVSRAKEDSAGDRRHHRTQARGGSAGSREAPGGTGQSRQVALSRRGEPRFAPAASDHQPAAEAPGEAVKDEDALNLVDAARRDACGHVGHAEHASRHQPARGRDRPSRIRQSFRSTTLLERLRDGVRLSCGSAQARLARGAVRALRSAAIRACSSR